MPRKPEPVTVPTVIKWTDEEWVLIARRLLEVKGQALIQSVELQEVRARDVFLAQDVLPEGRHRKLISISQGFQAIRQRMLGIMQTFKDGPSPKDSSAEPAHEPDSTPAPDHSARTQQELQLAAQPHEASSVALATATPVVETDNTVAAPIRSDVEDSVALTAKENSRGNRRNDGRMMPARTATTAPAAPSRPAPAVPTFAANGGFIEMARPFVAMVCQEFANALVNKLVEQGGGKAFSSLLHTPPTGASQMRPSPVSPTDEDDAEFAETDVQPLFDPKLPPSANSAFKPVIALIATSAHDAEDLQRLFPQLELSVVSLDELRTAPALRNCQRMIGLREEIPAPADEFLRKTFRNRYVRITGGLIQLREQLGAWLNNPGSMNASAGAPRKQGNFKGQGGGFPKKRQFRGPRTNA